LLDQAGFDGARLLETASHPDYVSRLDAATRTAAERGAFGSPTFFVGLHNAVGGAFGSLQAVRRELVIRTSCRPAWDNGACGVPTSHRGGVAPSGHHEGTAGPPQ